MPRFFETTSDRRQFPRTKLAEIAYIGMGPENGGLVLDVSDGGLSFHSVAPVQQSETIRFLLSLRGHSRIEGTGEVVWTDAMRTVCGLRFTSLSSGAREHLNNWTNQSRMPAAARGKPSSSAPSPGPQVENSPFAAASPATIPNRPLFAISPADLPYLSAPSGPSFLLEPRFLWAVMGLLGTVLVVVAFFVGVHVGKSQIASVARPLTPPAARSESPLRAPASESAPAGAAEFPASPATSAPGAPPDVSTAAAAIPSAEQQAPSATASAPIAAASNPSSAAVGALESDATTANKLSRPGTGKHGASAPDPHTQQEIGNSELAAALADLNGNSGRRDAAKAVKELWQAVGNGSTDAAVILSDLYMSGDGVVKNCEQARILLTAATRSGNLQARIKLGELETNGCQ